MQGLQQDVSVLGLSSSLLLGEAPENSKHASVPQAAPEDTAETSAAWPTSTRGTSVRSIRRSEWPYERRAWPNDHPRSGLPLLPFLRSEPMGRRRTTRPETTEGRCHATT